MQVGTIVKEFYNRTPFPDYDLGRFNDQEDLRLAAKGFAEILDRSIPAEASIIDIGTGTGQLSAYLSLRRKCVWGTDFSDKSLAKAKSLKDKLDLSSLYLKRVDVLDIEQIRAIGRRFDYVLCLGVLHHTGDAYQGFRNILSLLKPGGGVAIGLYNRFGRIPLKLRRILTKTLFRKNKRLKDWFIRMQIGDVQDKERARGWWNDQYLHPHETTHTADEVLGWFRANNIEYCQAVPSLSLFDEGELGIAGVWNKVGEDYFYPAGIYEQLTWIWKAHREGGYWVTFGKSKQK